MWNKIAKIGIEAGKAYIANRGVDGAIEDAQKVFGWAKKGANSLFSSNSNHEPDEKPELDFDKVQVWIGDCLAEMNATFREARRHDITSREFCENANIAFSIGYNAISQIFNMEGEIDDDDYDTLCSTYVDQIDNPCIQMLSYIGQKCQGRRNVPEDVTIGDEAGPICMQVYGVYPTNFSYSMTMLVAVIKNGIVTPGDTITLPDEDHTVAEIASIQMFGNEMDGAACGDLCCIVLKGDYTDSLPNDRVFQIGSMPNAVSSRAISGMSSNEMEDSEKEYLEEYKSCLEDDGEITARERRLLNRLRESLGISEERAHELEATCCCNELTSEEQEYADEVKSCLEDDGTITNRERRLLDRLAKSLKIAPERAVEIERLIVKH